HLKAANPQIRRAPVSCPNRHTPLISEDPLFVYRNAFKYLRYGHASAETVLMFVLTASIVWLQHPSIDRVRRGGLWAGSGLGG
ncbi:MAG: hypothetical protein WEE66_04075, partial [Actinomycetota bacterium]